MSSFDIDRDVDDVFYDRGTKEIYLSCGAGYVDVYVFKKIQIKRGVTNGIYTGIAPMEDIPESAKVVIEGAYYLMAMLTNEGEEE